MKHIVLILSGILLSAFSAAAQNMISAKNAAKHLGEEVTICDKVFSEHIRKFAITLSLGDEAPNELVTVLIKADFKTNLKGHFKNNTHFEEHYLGKEICVTGVVVKDKVDGKPMISVTDPSQIRPYLVDTPVKKKSLVN